MLPEVQNLIELQQADQEILRLKEEIAALPKRVAAIEQKLAGTKAGLEAAKAAIKTDEAARRKYEVAIQDLQGKISKYRDQSLEVKTNEQYKALLHEIQFAERDVRANEDKILELMVSAEAREKDVKAAELELKEETAEIEKEKVAARERTVENEKPTAAPVANPRRHRAHPKIDATQAWYYRAEYGDNGEVFLSFINAGGNSTRRVYDAHSGRKLGDTLMREGEYRLGFPEDLHDTIRLNGSWSEDELEEWE